MNWFGQIIAVGGTTGVAMHNQHGAGAWCFGRHFPTDDFAFRVLPGHEPVLGCDAFGISRRKFGWKINQLSLIKHHQQREQNVDDGQCQQHANR